MTPKAESHKELCEGSIKTSWRFFAIMKIGPPFVVIATARMSKYITEWPSGVVVRQVEDTCQWDLQLPRSKRYAKLVWNQQQLDGPIAFASSCPALSVYALLIDHGLLGQSARTVPGNMLILPCTINTSKAVRETVAAFLSLDCTQ